MKTLIIALILAISTITFGRGVESVESQTHKVNFKSSKISANVFKDKGLVFIKKLIAKQSSELFLSPVVKYKKVGSFEIKFTVRYIRLGKVLLQQSLTLTRSNRKLTIKTIKYDGFASYKLILDGVQQTFEHNPDKVDVSVDVSNSTNITNKNKIVNNERR